MCPLESSEKRFCLFCAILSNEGHIELIVSHQSERSRKRECQTLDPWSASDNTGMETTKYPYAEE